MRRVLDCVCLLIAMTIGGSPTVAALSTSAATGAIAGKVFDRSTGQPLSGVQVRAHAITHNLALPETVSDARGSFYLADAPLAVFAVNLIYEGRTYPVKERLDARFGRRFILETCFVLDRQLRTAAVSREECRSGFVPEAQVATLGPHRFFQPVAEAVAVDEALADLSGPLIDHSELECINHTQYPLLKAHIDPGQNVAIARVYFRSDKYPDFYYVEMEGFDLEAAGENFRAILPKPSPETERIIYYIEALDQALMNGRTEDYAPPVDDACRRDPAAAWFPEETPGLVVGATQTGVPAVPPGFQAAGITGFVSAAGVVTTTAAAAGAGAGAATASSLVIVVSGGAAAATGVSVAASGDNKEASPVK